MRRPHLAVVLPGIPTSEHGVEISDKTWTGLEAFRERWPGPLSVVARPVAQDVSGNLGRHWYALDDLPWQILLQDPAAAFATVRPDVAQVPLHLSERPLLSRAACVVAAENPARERFRYAASGMPRHHVPRMALGAVRQGWALRAMVRDAAAVACNGWAAWNAYRGAGRGLVTPLLYFDTRLAASRVAQAAARLDTRRDRRDEIRLAFSGRMHPAKGAEHVVAASAELDARGISHSLIMLGDGPDRALLEAESGDSVTWAGELAFEPDWIDLVSSSVDLMVLPHTQGDPSGTYLEAAGLGVPVVGFDNAALRGHAAHGGFSVTTSHWSGRALADLVQSLAIDTDRRDGLAAAGVGFMTKHALEPTFDARVEQLLTVAGSA